ncbi:MAG: response regulator transcription factor [Candidatus Limnocylindrales bacterium]|jgi:DNA-binding response OmpR family regulator
MAAKEDRPILVVDDDAKIVRLVRAYLEREGYRVVGATDGRAALSAIELERPALVVLDLMLPEIDGLSVVRSIRAAADDTPVIILSARGTTADRINGLASGADDYLAKPFSPAELVLRVGRVLARSRPALDAVPARPAGGVPPTGSSEPIVHGQLVVDPDRHTVTLAGRDIALTAVEFRLLLSLLEADGRVLTRDQLLDAIYGQDAEGVLERTIDVHVGRLRDKLDDVAAEPRFVATVRGVGYRSTARPPAAAVGGGPFAPAIGSGE